MKTGISERYENIQEYIQGKINVKELSAILQISRQQTYRLIKSFNKKEKPVWNIKVHFHL